MEWSDFRNNLTLRKNEVHIWRANLDLFESQSKTESILSADEIERANRFKFDKHRFRFINSRIILRKLISRYLKIEPEEIIFKYGKYGKPFYPNKMQIEFNMSHSKNIALFSFTKNFKIGVDVEFLNSEIELEDIAKRFFAKNEIKAFWKLPQEKRTEGFYNCWTRKEAFIKAVGEGLSYPLDKFEVSLEPNKKARLISIDGKEKKALNWSMFSFQPEKDFIGSVVVDGNTETVKYFNW